MVKIKTCTHTHRGSDVSQPLNSPLLHPIFLLSTSLQTISRDGFTLLRVPTLSQDQDSQSVKHREALEAAEFCTDFLMFPGSSYTSGAPRSETSQILPLRACSQQTHHLHEDLFVLQPRLEMHSLGHSERPLHIHPQVTQGPLSSLRSLCYYN